MRNMLMSIWSCRVVLPLYVHSWFLLSLSFLSANVTPNRSFCPVSFPSLQPPYWMRCSPPSFLLFLRLTQRSRTAVASQTCDFWGRWTPRPSSGRGGMLQWRPGQSRAGAVRRPGPGAGQRSQAPHSPASTGVPDRSHAGTVEWGLELDTVPGTPEEKESEKEWEGWEWIDRDIYREDLVNWYKSSVNSICRE